MNHLEAERYENAALRDQISKLKLMHLSAESELMSAQEREKMLRKEVLRLTATVETQHTTITLTKMIADKAEAREKALRAITGLMAPHPRVWDDAWSNCCAEWDLRASGIV